MNQVERFMYNTIVYALQAELKSCSIRRDIEWGRRIHAKTVECLNGSNTYIATALIKMYAKCCRMLDARHMFHSIQNPNVVTWTVLVLGYAENGEGDASLNMFSRMKACGCVPDSVTYVAALKACISLAANGDYLELGKNIHSEIGCYLNHYVRATLIKMYAKFGSMLDARCVFDSVENPDVVSWNALLMGYADCGEGHVVLDLFAKMKARGYAPDAVTYIAALKACTSLAVNGSGECLKLGKEIHLQIDCHLDHYIESTLIDMYAKCGSMVDARDVFDSIKKPSVESWNTLLLGYADNGQEYLVLDLFSTMKFRGYGPNSVTYIAPLKACTALALNGDGNCLKRGRQIHFEIGCHLDHYLQSTLIEMYAKCGSMIEARGIFDGMQKPDVVSWTALLLAYAENGEGLAALEMFSTMKSHGYVPDSVTYVAAFKACGLIGDLALGRKIHSEMNQFNAHVVTCLISFYAKCGSVVEAHSVFDLHLNSRDVPTWNALLAAYASFGNTGTCVFELFEAMQEQGFRPDAVTFVCMLLCCNHAGLVEKASNYFQAMSMQYGITQTSTHYNCMLDVLGRGNQLNNAIALLRKMPYNPSLVTWTALLAACRKWKNVEIGRMAFRSLVYIDDKDLSAYVLMAHVFGSRGMWDEQNEVLEIKFGSVAT